MPSPNPATRHEHVGGAVSTTLSASMSAGDTSFTIANNTGWPTGAVGTFYVVLDVGTASEEKVLCSTQSAGTVGVAGGGRGADGTTAKAHLGTTGTVRVCWTAQEADEVNAHAAASTAVHGVAGAVVGTTDSQTLTNKTISGATNTITNIGASSITDSELAAIAGLTSAADRLAYFTGAGTAALANFAAAARSMLALTAAADRLPYFDSTTTAALATFTTYARTLMDDANAAAARTTLELGTAPVLNVYTAGATWNKPAAGTFLGVWAECQGGGGGGGGAAATTSPQVSPGAGGNGGNYARAWIAAASLASTVTVTVGAGGAGNSGAAGSNGGNASFGAHVVASGGLGGPSAAAGTTAAISSVAATNTANTGSATRMDVAGSNGEHGVRIDSAFGWAGFGGASFFGGIQPGPTTAAADGITGQTYGGGGSGGRNNATNSARPGGTGGAGLVVVTEVYS